ncbi:MAG: hypothetical protein IJS93_02310 [Clostridia bacterium]|nr:hypothetical protein [Clostridia bacterium]
MNKKHIKTLSLIALVLVLSFALTLCLFACKNAETEQTTDSSSSETETETETATVLITNGDFATTSGTSAPYTAGTWTVSSSNSSAQTVAGVIHTGSLYTTENANSAWAGIADPGKANAEDKDDALFMIYNSEANAYTATNKFTAAVGAYYKVTVDFKSIGNSQGAEGGAFVTFTGAAYHKFGPFAPSTEGWQTVTFYIQSSLVEDQTVNVKLSLGDANNVNSIGVVFFDNVVATKITQDEYNTFTVTNSTLQAKYSMLLSDGDFVNNSGYSNPTDSEVWSKSIGKDDDNNSAITTYVKAGVVNVDSFDDWKEIVGDKEDENNVNPGTPYDTYKDVEGYEDLSADRNVLMITSFPAISHITSKEAEKNAYTAVGYSNKYKMTIELGSYYELKVWVKTNLTDPEYKDPNANGGEEEAEAEDIVNSGAWLKVTGLNNDAVIKNIDTNGAWVEYTFAIVGHEYRNKTVNLEMWLGQGGRTGNELACGTAYFDNVRLVKKGTFTSATRQAVIDDYKDVNQHNPTYTCVVDVASLNGASLTENTDIINPNFDVVGLDNYPDGWNFAFSSDVKGNVSVVEGDDISNSDVLVRVFDTTAAEQQANAAVEGKTDDEKEEALKKWWLEKYGVEENPSAPTDALNPVLMINNTVASAYTMTLDNDINIVKNLHYRLAIWVKTAGIESGKGATITLVNKSNDDATLSSFTNVNTASYENETTNGYAEYVFYIKGSNFVSVNGADDDKVLSLKIELGSGNAYDPSSFIKGALFIANVNLEQVTYEEYNAVSTGDRIKTASLTSSLGTVSNGSFNGYTYDDKQFDTGDENTVGTGYQTDYLAPSNWTKGSLPDDVKSGIVNINSTDFIADEFGANYVFYNEWDNGIDNGKPVDFGAPNLLVINVPATSPIESQLAYKTSSTVSLSSNKYYVIKAYARSVGGIVGEISVSANNNSKPIYQKIKQSVNDGWQEIVFAFQTGTISSTSATINIYVGNYSVDSVTEYEEGSEPKYSGMLFLDSFTYYEVEKSNYEAIVANEGVTASYLTDTFSSESDSTKTSSAKNWTGSGEKISSGIATTDKTQYAGIFTQTYGDESIFKLVEEKTVLDGEEEKSEMVAIEGSTMTKDEIFNSNGMVDATVGDGVLVINNQVASYANYKNTSSITFEKNSYYKVSVYARTKGIEKGKYATVRVETGSDAVKYEIPVNTEYNEDKDASGNKTYTATENKWQLFTFYVKTAESTSTSSVYLYLSLGTSDDKVQGYAFFDNVTVEKLEDAAEFNAAYAMRYEVDAQGNAVVDEKGQYVNAETADEFLKNNRIIRADDAKNDDADTDTDDNTSTDEGNKTSSELLWLYITSIVIAGLLIVVIVVYLLRKHLPKKAIKASAKDVDYARKSDEDGKPAEKKSDEFKD